MSNRKKRGPGFFKKSKQFRKGVRKYVKADAKRKPSKRSPMSWLFG